MIHATHLRTEFTEEPVGIGTPQPRMSWVVEADRRGELQSAYRIQVATSTQRLAGDEPDLWDSGQCSSDQSWLISYAGTALRSHMECFWRVMLWDRDGQPGPWSQVSSWSMGILDNSGWVAEWIGYDAPGEIGESFPRVVAQWIWFQNDGDEYVPSPRCALAAVLVLDASKEIARVELAVAAKDSVRLFVNGREAAGTSPEGWKRPVVVRDASLFRPGKNVIYAEAACEGGVAPGFILWLVIHHPDGSQTTMSSDSTWRSSEHLMPRWKTDGPGAEEGRPARSMGSFGFAPWRLLDESMLHLPPARYLKGRVAVGRLPRRAMLYASAFGIADLYVNGFRVSEDRFTPGWTDYGRRIYYRAYDVTPLIALGLNVLGAVLADGWFSGYIGWGALRGHYGTAPRLRAQLHVEFDDGSTEEFGTGPSWVAGTGAVREADLLMGERHDAREPHREFFLSEEFPSHAVDLGGELHPVVAAHPGPPVRAFATLSPVAITEPKPGVWVFDLGRNFAGVARLRLREDRGREILLRFAERLSPDGMIYTENLRSARAEDRYICSGDGEEVWEPRFTFHGFQYVEVTGLSAAPTSGTITGIALSSDTPRAGEFKCSSAMLNRLASNILWTQRANFIDVPTDCPQRDERLGWTGDAQVYARSACLNVDAQAFFHKWIRDLNDAQREDGQFPEVAPLKVAGSDGGPAWADAGVICPWTVYEIYGDRAILENSYEHMKRFVDFCQKRSRGVLPPEQFHCFGDWLNIQAETPKEVIATAYFAHVSRLLSHASEILGKTAEAEHYGELAGEVRSAFRRAYLKDDGTIQGSTQTVYALALSFGLLEAQEVERAAMHLLADIERRGGRLSTGFVGTKELMHALSRLGRHDVAYRILLSEEFPSWGFTIRHGATSIWERWDGWTPERGFQDPHMNSFAHYAFGAVYEWMVATIGGIRAAEPGYRRIVIEPVLHPSLEWARVGYRSVAGRVVSEWHRSGARLHATVEIPANTHGTVVLPMVPGTVSESGVPAEKANDLKEVRSEGRGCAVEVGGGRYEFEGEALKARGGH